MQNPAEGTTMTGMTIYRDLTDEARQHLALVCSLDVLADADGASAQRERQRCGDRTQLRRGDVVLVLAAQRWRYGIVTDLGGAAPDAVRVAYLLPSALEAAQRTWSARSGPLLQAQYPEEEATAARARYANDITASVQAGEIAYRDAVLTQAVAQGCTRRPWAAVVPVRYTYSFTTKVYVADDQTRRWTTHLDPSTQSRHGSGKGMKQIDVATMNPDELIDAVRASMPENTPAARAAIGLLLNHDSGVWLRDNTFRTRAIRINSEADHPVQMALPQLGKMLTELNTGAPWTTAHGPAASTALWLACELAAGRLGELAGHDDPDTASMVTATIAAAFDRHPANKPQDKV